MNIYIFDWDGTLTKGNSLEILIYICMEHVRTSFTIGSCLRLVELMVSIPFIAGFHVLNFEVVRDDMFPKKKNAQIKVIQKFISKLKTENKNH